MKKYEYNIFLDNSSEKFKTACHKIEETYPEIEKKKTLIDVDGSTIQIYHIRNQKIAVYNDYEVGAVYILSDLDLNEIKF